MVVSNWDETQANGRRRVFRIEIDNPINYSPVANWHLERVFTDTNDTPIASSMAGSWSVALLEALKDPVLAPLVTNVSTSLESIAQILYERESANQALVQPNISDNTPITDPTPDTGIPQ